MRRSKKKRREGKKGGEKMTFGPRAVFGHISNWQSGFGLGPDKKLSDRFGVRVGKNGPIPPLLQMLPQSALSVILFFANTRHNSHEDDTRRVSNGPSTEQCSTDPPNGLH